MSTWLSKWTMSHEEFAEMFKADPHNTHQAVWDFFGNKHADRKFLFRVLKNQHQCSILVQSEYPVVNRPITGTFLTKEIQITLSEGTYRFELTGNPVVSKSRMHLGNKNSTRVPLYKTDDIVKWFTAMMDKKGFSVESVSVGPVMTDYSATKKFQLGTCDLQGVLRVIDAAAATEASLLGVGKERSYGCGLLCLVPIAQETVSDSNEDSDD